MSVSKEIINVLDALADKFGIVVDWTSSNVIPYLNQLSGKYISYEIVTSIFWAILGIILLILSVIFYKKGIKNFKKSKDYENYCRSQRDDFEALFIIEMVVTVVLTVMGIGCLLCNIYDIITCYTFPEKIIIATKIKSTFHFPTFLFSTIINVY